jgi:hypothetical protein
MNDVRYKPLAFLGFPDYRVGDNGSVWRLNCRRGWVQLKPKTSGRRYGHLSVCLCARGKVKEFLVHRLVLFAFVGPCPEGMECRHFPDRDPANNHLDNLQWGTRKRNHQDRTIHGTNNAGSTNGSAKLTEEQVVKIRELYATGEYEQADLEVMFNCSGVGYMVRGETWRHVGGPLTVVGCGGSPASKRQKIRSVHCVSA